MPAPRDELDAAGIVAAQRADAEEAESTAEGRWHRYIKERVMQSGLAHRSTCQMLADWLVSQGQEVDEDRFNEEVRRLKEIEAAEAAHTRESTARARRNIERGGGFHFDDLSRQEFSRVPSVRAKAQVAVAVRVPAGVVATPREASSRRAGTAKARGPDDSDPSEPHLVRQPGWTARAVVRHVAHLQRRQRRRFEHLREWKAFA